MKRRNDNKPKQRQKLKKWYYPKTTRTSKTIMQRRQHQDAEEPHQIKTTMTNKRHHLKKQLYTESTLLYITKRKYAFYVQNTVCALFYPWPIFLFRVVFSVHQTIIIIITVLC